MTPSHQLDGIVLGSVLVAYGVVILTGLVPMPRVPLYPYGQGSAIPGGAGIIVLCAMKANMTGLVVGGLLFGVALIYQIAAQTIGVPWFLEAPSVRDSAPHRIAAFQRKHRGTHVAAVKRASRAP